MCSEDFDTAHLIQDVPICKLNLPTFKELNKDIEGAYESFQIVLLMYRTSGTNVL